MAKLTMPAEAAKELGVRERVLLFCIGGLGRPKAGISDAVVTHVVVKGLADRDAAGVLALTDRGRAVLRASSPTYVPCPSNSCWAAHLAPKSST